MRGEHRCPGRGSQSSTGSAPRARGTRRHRHRQDVATGISPACAGNTHSSAATPGATIGSAPRARGTRRGREPGGQRRRISPACAGNTAPSGRSLSSMSDQPRVRGEHVSSRSIRSPLLGSAPRARGTQQDRRRPGVSVRISPACAGNTQSAPSRRPRSADQPRVRGEHISSRARSTPVAGSAPRARGTRTARMPRPPRDCISPACAGNTPCLTILCDVHSDQPRVRGEHPIARTPTDNVYGSAPRARGTLSSHRELRSSYRISPACAENTFRRSIALDVQGDQPRVRGEHNKPRISELECVGSAPRARGTPARSHEDGKRVRISPACAGNTRERQQAVEL